MQNPGETIWLTAFMDYWRINNQSMMVRFQLQFCSEHKADSQQKKLWARTGSVCLIILGSSPPNWEQTWFYSSVLILQAEWWHPSGSDLITTPLPPVMRNTDDDVVLFSSASITSGFLSYLKQYVFPVLNGFKFHIYITLCCTGDRRSVSGQLSPRLIHLCCSDFLF